MALRITVETLQQLEQRDNCRSWDGLSYWQVRLDDPLLKDVELAEGLGHCNVKIIPGPEASSGAPEIPLQGMEETDIAAAAQAYAVREDSESRLADASDGRDLSHRLIVGNASVSLQIALNLDEPLWIRSEDRANILQEKWLETAERARQADKLYIVSSDEYHALVTTMASATSVPPVSKCREDDAIGSICAAMSAVADTVSWLHLADDIDRGEGQVSIRLHQHQQWIELDPDVVSGSPQGLLEWLRASPDPIREEALRHTFRSMAPSDELPSPEAVRNSAEQYLVLFSQERSLEMLRARETSRRSIQAALEDTRARSHESVRDAMRDALATVLSMVALLAAASRLAPAATVGAIIIISLVILFLVPISASARISRMHDALDTLKRAKNEAEDSPFLTAGDRDRLATLAGVPELASEIRKQKRRVCMVAVLSVLGALTIAGIAGIVTLGSDQSSSARQQINGESSASSISQELNRINHLQVTARTSCQRVNARMRSREWGSSEHRDGMPVTLGVSI